MTMTGDDPAAQFDVISRRLFGVPFDELHEGRSKTRARACRLQVGREVHALAEAQRARQEQERAEQSRAEMRSRPAGWYRAGRGRWMYVEGDTIDGRQLTDRSVMRFARMEPTDIDEALARARRIGRCMICGRVLDDPVSVARGAGPVCWPRSASPA